MFPIGERIRQLREARGWTQDQLAARLGISRSTLANYETGRREPDLKTLFDIGHELNTSIAFLVGETDESTPVLSGWFPPQGTPGSPLPLYPAFIRLTDLMIERGVSFRDLTDKYGIDITDLMKLNSRDPDLSVIQRLANSLNTTMHYLLGRIDDPAPLPGVAVAHHDPEKGVDIAEPLPPQTQLIVERAILEAKREWGWNKQTD